MENGRGRHSGSNWQNNSGSDRYHYHNNSGGTQQLNHGWNDNNHRGGNRRGQENNFNRNTRSGQAFGDDLNNHESFAKFRDSSQPDRGIAAIADNVKNKHQRGGNQKRHNKVGGGRRNGGGGGRGNGGGGRGGFGGGNRNGGGSRNSGRNGGHGNRGDGGGRNCNDRSYADNAGEPWYDDQPMESDIFYFTNGQLDDSTAQAQQPVREASVVPTPEPPSMLLTTQPPIAPTPPPSAPATVPEVPTTAALITAANIKKEKKDPLPAETVKAEKPQESSEDSSSSSSDESHEAGEVIKPTPPAPKANAAIVQKTKAAAATSSSSSEDSSSEEESPVKTKTAVKAETTLKSPKKLKRVKSEDDVVCIGNETRKYTIPDDEQESEESSESEAGKEQKSSKGKNKEAIVCVLCDKKGHTSFECQMICRNCAAPYHSLKNCPNPPNLTIALQAFLEFTMQQMSVFNMDKRFAFPGSIVTAPTVPPMAAPAAAAANTTTKKEKRSSAKSKTKKVPKKKIKVEAHESDDEDEDEDSSSPASSSSESSESSSESPQPAVKTKRKRSSKPAAPNLTPAAAFPFPMLAAGAPYNSMMYPYGAPFSFPK